MHLGWQDVRVHIAACDPAEKLCYMYGLVRLIMLQKIYKMPVQSRAVSAAVDAA